MDGEEGDERARGVKWDIKSQVYKELTYISTCDKKIYIL